MYWRKIFLSVLATAIVVSAIIGVVERRNFTNLTAGEDFMDNFDMWLLPSDLALLMEETYHEEVVPHANIIIRAKGTDKIDIGFQLTRQWVVVEEVFKDDSRNLNVGDEISVHDLSWAFFFNFNGVTSANMFNNFMKQGDEYLIFLDHLVTPLERWNPPSYQLTDGGIISPVFNYENTENIIPDNPIVEEDLLARVPYKEVQYNEFFVDSEDALGAMESLKHSLLQLYPKGSSDS